MGNCKETEGKSAIEDSGLSFPQQPTCCQFNVQLSQQTRFKKGFEGGQCSNFAGVAEFFQSMKCNRRKHRSASLRI